MSRNQAISFNESNEEKSLIQFGSPRPRLCEGEGSQRFASCAVLCLLLFTGCAQEMMNQRRVESQEHTDAYADGSASRRLPQHTIAASETALTSTSVGQTPVGVPTVRAARTDNDDGYWDGRVDGELVDVIPKRIVEHRDLQELIRRGQQRFNISCAPCHDRTGSGNGMVARRGFKYPPSYHTDRLRQQPLAYIFNVATSGRGQMPSYGDFISTDDRWAITAYVRTLQFSQYAPQSELDESDLQELQESGVSFQLANPEPQSGSLRNEEAP